ncbi:transposase [Maribellus maritimus]|uniref:transposase n=1 Tax=Maribellus maritimus TaxID=2870838 RepID=UPI00374DE267
MIIVCPKVSISDLMDILKGHIQVINKFKDLKQKQYWGNHLWSKVYCVDKVGLDAEIIKRYVKFQGDKDKREGQ